MTRVSLRMTRVSLRMTRVSLRMTRVSLRMANFIVQDDKLPALEVRPGPGG
jgi:hypothetical protein